MAAITWNEVRAGGQEVTRAEIYERFFQQIAMGKCEQDKDGHEPVANASQRLLKRLVEKGELGKPLPNAPENESRAMAMLWMLSRIAWESRRCAERNEDLTLYEVTGILKGEVGLGSEASALEMIKVGVLLVLQADQQGGNHQILFGHKSFREFLVARYWAQRLDQIVAARHDHRRFTEIEEQLLGARLLGEDDESFDFLMQIVNAPAWGDANRAALVKWAEECFNNEGPYFADRHATSWLKDQRPVLREAALAIGSSAKGSPGIRPAGSTTLRPLLGWFQTKNLYPRVKAEKLISTDAELTHMWLPGADLRYAKLEVASLKGAHLEGANLYGADLQGANLLGAYLQKANLREADLELAMAEGADFDDADLGMANLQRAFFGKTHLNKANLKGANLRSAHLYMALIAGANLEEADLMNADLGGANLQGANLQGANLRNAILQGANLQGTNLYKVLISNESIRNGSLRGAQFNERTIWPDGFDALAAGALKTDSTA